MSKKISELLLDLRKDDDVVAVVVDEFGGAVGLVLVFAGSYLATSLLGFEVVLTLNKIIIGLATSSVIGLVAGYVPALMASRLDPVEAMRMNA